MYICFLSGGMNPLLRQIFSSYYVCFATLHWACMSILGIQELLTRMIKAHTHSKNQPFELT